MVAQDVSGGGSSSTSIEIGVNEECKETGGGVSASECIVHTHEYPVTLEDIACVPKTYVAPTDDGTYCVTEEITVSATSTGEDTPGKTVRSYGPCQICGQAYPGTNPEESPHESVIWPTIEWTANDCGADPSKGDGTTAVFTAKEASPSVGGSSVVFSEKSSGACDKCGTIEAVIDPDTTYFTVEKVESVKCENVSSYTADPHKPETLYLANNGWDNTPDPDELKKTVIARLKPKDATPTEDKTWEGAGVTASNALTTTWKSKEFKLHDISYGCGHSKKVMKIAVEGASIVSAVPDTEEEYSDKYLGVFLNENFTKDKDASTVEDGHHECKVPDNDVDDPESKAEGLDELVGFSLEWFKYQDTEYDDTDAKLQLAGYDENVKIYTGSSEDDMVLYDGAMQSIDEYWKYKTCLRIEGIKAGQFQLQLNMQTRDSDSVLVDQVNVKVFPLDIMAIDPAPSSDDHEICDIKMMIMVNDNDSDNDGIIDLLDNKVAGGDPDLATVRIMKPEGIVKEDMKENIALSLHDNIKAYSKKDKSEEAPLQYAYDTFEEKGYVELYLEGRKASTEILDSAVKVEMSLKDGSKCRDELRYSVAAFKMIPNYDRDGDIDSYDRKLVEIEKPYYFWINNDDDVDAVSGNDSPKALKPDCKDKMSAEYSIDGIRDLIDFFPVAVELKDTANVFTSDNFEFVLIHPDEAVNCFFKAELTSGQADYHLTDKAFCDKNAEQSLEHINGEGMALPDDFLELVKNDKNIILLEGYAATKKPLVLEMRRKCDGITLCKTELPLSLDSVEKMFRHKNLRSAAGGTGGEDDRTETPNYPESETNDTNFVFVHGYNVTGDEAHGSQCEVFKRMFWSGSKAKFHGITWRGDETRIGSFTPDYHTNVVNALNTADELAGYINGLGGEVVVAGHSLGNMLSSSAISNHYANAKAYFIIDGAVAMEAYNPGEAKVKGMRHKDWEDYYFDEKDDFLFSSEWHTIFSGNPNDPRGRLTWRGIFNDMNGVACYNFYSTGEDVMINIPYESGYVAWDAFTYSWGCQEKFKGNSLILGMLPEGYNWCGWGFNTSDYGKWKVVWIREPPGQARKISKEQLKTKPFFLKKPAELFAEDVAVAQSYAMNNRFELLAKGFPARTFGIGANKIDKFSSSDMMNMKTGWYSNDQDKLQWRHSDFKNVAYLYTHKVYDNIVMTGGLK